MYNPIFYIIGILVYLAFLYLGRSSVNLVESVMIVFIITFTGNLAYLKRYADIVAVLIICSAIGLEVVFIGWLPKLRLEDIIGFIVLPMVIASQMSHTYLYQEYLKNNFVRLIMVFCAIAIISPLHAYIVGLTSFNLRDYFQFFLNFKWALIVFFLFRIHWTVIKFERILTISIIAFGTAAIIGILQAYEVNFMNEIIHTYWSREHHFINSGIGGRQTGSSAGPGQYGGLLLIGSCLSISYFLFYGGMKKFFGFIVLTLTVIALLSSGSRTSIISAGVAIVVIALYSLRYTNMISIAANVLLLLAGSIYVYSNYFYMSEYMSDFFEVVLHPLSDGSFANRYGGYVESFTQFLPVSPLFGWGPGKGLIHGNNHGEYQYIATRYGIIGLVWLLIFFYYSFTISSRLLKLEVKYDRISKIFGHLTIGLTVGLIVRSTTSTLFFPIQFANAFFPFLAITVILYHYQKQIMNANYHKLRKK